MIGDEQRASKLLYDLLAYENARNARIAEQFDAGQEIVCSTGSLLTAITRVFAAGNLDLGFQITASATIDAVTNTEQKYPISEMSDGEKSAFLLSAQVLLSPPKGVLILDEPERHLHRAVSADLISALMQERDDCGFVLLTHDLDLATRLDPQAARLYTVMSVRLEETKAAGWAMQSHSTDDSIPDAARRAIQSSEGVRSCCSSRDRNRVSMHRSTVCCSPGERSSPVVDRIRSSKQ